MLYHYQANSWQVSHHFPKEQAVFTTFRSDTKNLDRHWQRLCSQTEQQFSQRTQLSLQQLQQFQRQFATEIQVVKFIITKTQQWYIALRQLPKKKPALKLQGVYDWQRNEQARIKDAQRHYYLEQLQISREQGFDDALYYDSQDIVLETTIASLFWSDGNQLYMPMQMLPILPGTFASQVIDWCREWEIEVHQVTWTYAELKKQARQIWCCNAVSGWQVIAQLDDDWQSQPTAWTIAITHKITQQEW